MTSGAWLAWALPVFAGTSAAACTAQKDGAGFQNLSTHQAEIVRTVASLILPTDDTPGAEEFGVVYFIDRAFDTFFAEPNRTALLDGLSAFDTAVRAKYGAALPQLSHQDQIAALTDAEDTPFFGMIRFLTLAGAFSHPDHGGNRDQLGWQLLGFNAQHAWAPPFGHYDRDAHSDTAGDM